MRIWHSKGAFRARKAGIFFRCEFGRPGTVRSCGNFAFWLGGGRNPAFCLGVDRDPTFWLGADRASLFGWTLARALPSGWAWNRVSLSGWTWTGSRRLGGRWQELRLPGGQKAGTPLFDWAQADPAFRADASESFAFRLGASKACLPCARRPMTCGQGRRPAFFFAPRIRKAQPGCGALPLPTAHSGNPETSGRRATNCPPDERAFGSALSGRPWFCRRSRTVPGPYFLRGSVLSSAQARCL